MNLFVARLNSCTTAKDLQKLFAHYGLVTTVKVILDRATGKSKCYGFIEMPNIYEAHEALKELDNFPFQTSLISVRESVRPDPQLSGTKSGFRNRNGSSRLPENSDFQEARGGYSLSQPKSNVEMNSRRNYGYRGSGYGYFR